MKKIIVLSLLTQLSIATFAQTQNWDGITIVEHSYGQKISNNGEWTVGFPADGGTIVYNRVTQEAQYYPYSDFTKGTVIANNGWAVGCQMIDDEATRAVVMRNGTAFTPDVFNKNYSSNIHSITPDASRICGVVGNPGHGQTYLPFYCDIDAEGNFGELQYLPYPNKDFFGSRPQYCSANWLSADGKMIAGQVVDSRGFAVYPIIYTQNNSGTWNYSFPSENLFNLEGLEVPPPYEDIEEMFPDLVYPEIENFMDPSDYLRFVMAGEPYEDLGDYMTLEQVDAYYAAVDAYMEAQIIYEEYFATYDDSYWYLVDSSILFVRNAVALSSDGKWYAASAQVDDLSDPMNPVGYYIPYLCNLETGEWTKIGEDKKNYKVNQVLPGGMVVMNSMPSGEEPVSTFIYLASTGELLSLVDYLKIHKPSAVDWIEDNLTGDVIIGYESDGVTPIFKRNVTFTGQASFSDDTTIMASGVDGYVLSKDMYFTYILDDITSDVKKIEADLVNDGLITIYNLQGVRVLSTKNPSDINSLMKGIYIVVSDKGKRKIAL